MFHMKQKENTLNLINVSHETKEVISYTLTILKKRKDDVKITQIKITKKEISCLLTSPLSPIRRGLLKAEPPVVERKEK